MSHSEEQAEQREHVARQLQLERRRRRRARPRAKEAAGQQRPACGGAGGQGGSRDHLEIVSSRRRGADDTRAAGGRARARRAAAQAAAERTALSAQLAEQEPRWRGGAALRPARDAPSSDRCGSPRLARRRRAPTTPRRRARASHHLDPVVPELLRAAECDERPSLVAESRGRRRALVEGASSAPSPCRVSPRRRPHRRGRRRPRASAVGDRLSPVETAPPSATSERRARLPPQAGLGRAPTRARECLAAARAAAAHFNLASIGASPATSCAARRHGRLRD